MLRFLVGAHKSRAGPRAVVALPRGGKNCGWRRGSTAPARARARVPALASSTPAQSRPSQQQRGRRALQSFFRKSKLGAPRRMLSFCGCGSVFALSTSTGGSPKTSQRIPEPFLKLQNKCKERKQAPSSCFLLVDAGLRCIGPADIRNAANHRTIGIIDAIRAVNNMTMGIKDVRSIANTKTVGIRDTISAVNNRTIGIRDAILVVMIGQSASETP